MSISMTGVSRVSIPVLIASGYLSVQLLMILLVAAMSDQPAIVGSLPFTGSGQ